MIHVGVDIAKSSHKVAAISECGQTIWKPFSIEQTQAGFEELDRKLQEIAPLGVQIGMEATGHYWLLLHAFLAEKGWTCIVFNPVLTKKTAASTLRGRKTDADDALGIALTIREGGFTPFHPPDADRADLLVLARLRETHAKELRNAKKRMGGFLDRVFPEFRSCFSDPYGKSALAFLAAFRSPDQIAKATPSRLARPMVKTMGKTRARKKALEIREAARNSPARALEDTGRMKALDLMVKHLRTLQQSLRRAEEAIEELYSRMDHPAASITGIGAVTGPVILAELARFNGEGKSNRRMVRGIMAYAGLDPRIKESGTFKGRPKMTKRGSKTLRTALFQAASMARIHSPHFAAVYGRQMARGKHHNVAINHVARKLVEVFVAVEKSGEPFNPEKMASA